MAVAFRATMRIKAAPDVVFEPGDIVTGLTRDQMRDLWEAGALEQVASPSSGEAGAPSSKPGSNGSDAGGSTSSDGGDGEGGTEN